MRVVWRKEKNPRRWVTQLLDDSGDAIRTWVSPNIHSRRCDVWDAEQIMQIMIENRNEK